MMANGARRPFFEILRITLANSVSHTLQMLHVMSVDKTPKMCSNYGHIITRGYWGKGLPKCEECGATIKDPSELRKATPQKELVSSGR
jgi:hypothetical protein